MEELARRKERGDGSVTVSLELKPNNQNLKVITVLSTGNEELDLRLGGGIPFPSLMLIEGDHGTGKSVLALQFTYGALRAGLRTYVCSTEALVKGYLAQAKKLSYDLYDFFIKGKLKIIPIHMEGVAWAKELAKYLLTALSKYMTVTKAEYDVFVIDTFSVLAVYSDMSSILNFLTEVRTITGEGKLIIMTLHPKGLPEDASLRLKSICDGYFRLSLRDVGGKSVKVMEVIKLRGAPSSLDATVVFDVEPAFGIKIIPIGLAKA